MTHYVALDVSLRTVSLCVIDAEGQIKAEAKLPTEVEDIPALELISPPTPTGCPSRGRGLDEAEYDCCALEHAQKHGSPHRPTNACSGLTTDQNRLRRGA